MYYKLTGFFLEGKITDHEKRVELINRRDKIMKELKAHNNADDAFSERIIGVLNLAANAYKLFLLSMAEEKRQLMNLAFSTIKLNGHKLAYTLRSPFDQFVNLPKNGEWLRVVYDLLTQSHARQYDLNSAFIMVLASPSGFTNLATLLAKILR